MKKFLLIMTSVVLITSSVAGCGKQKKEPELSDAEIAQQLEEDIQGYWLGEDSVILMGFNSGEYFLHLFGSGSVPGAYSFDGDELTTTFWDDDFEDMIYTVKIDDDILTLTSEKGGKTEWERISESEVRDLLSEY